MGVGVLSCLRSPGRLCWLIVLGRFTNSNVLVTDYRCLLNWYPSNGVPRTCSQSGLGVRIAGSGIYLWQSTQKFPGRGMDLKARGWDRDFIKQPVQCLAWSGPTTEGCYYCYSRESLRARDWTESHRDKGQREAGRNGHKGRDHEESSSCPQACSRVWQLNVFMDFLWDAGC